jgi:hypothetical protein
MPLRGVLGMTGTKIGSGMALLGAANQKSKEWATH